MGEKIADPIQNYLADVFTVAANLAGLPALSIPAGFANGLPIGLQLMGKHFSESRLLQYRSSLSTTDQLASSQSKQIKVIYGMGYSHWS